MRRLRRITPARRNHPAGPGSRAPRTLDESLFDRAAGDQGFSLDAAQRDAASALASGAGNLYLWGPAGRGKSWLMDTYFAALPTDRKSRVHFHEFFRDLHRAIRRHHHDLEAALDELLAGVDLVCFDEFHVHDPADGTFIARLLPALLDRRIRVIATSNYPPGSLMPNPLFHHTFLPSIRLIEQSFMVLAVDGPVDHRTESRHRDGFASGWWISPGTIEQRRHLGLRPPSPRERTTLTPAGHPVRALGTSDRRLWVDFADLCEATTAPVDYLALAGRYPTWVIDGIPDLRRTGREPMQRFANAVDVLYDRDVTAVFLAATPPDQLVDDPHPSVDIERIASRLGELRTQAPRLPTDSTGSDPALT